MSESGTAEHGDIPAKASPGRKFKATLIRLVRFCTVVLLGALVGVGAYYLLKLLS